VRVTWPADDKANIVYVIREGVDVYEAVPTILAGATFHGVSSAATVTTRYQLNTAKFYDPTVAPANNVRATLQRWNGKAWASIKWVYLTKGVARYTFPAAAAAIRRTAFFSNAARCPPGRRQCQAICQNSHTT
jgi:hypothetical protein